MHHYAISNFSKENKLVQLETLPVAKITEYPLEKRDYKPYAQVSVGIDCKGIHLRFASFEVSPKEGSTIGAVLYLFPRNPETYLEVWATPHKVVAQMVSSNETIVMKTQIEQRNGEDLQGQYWGYDVTVLSDFVLDETEVQGNFYKVQKESSQHYGGFGKMDLTVPLTAKENMTTLEVVTY